MLPVDGCFCPEQKALVDGKCQDPEICGKFQSINCIIIFNSTSLERITFFIFNLIQFSTENVFMSIAQASVNASGIKLFSVKEKYISISFVSSS